MRLLLLALIVTLASCQSGEKPQSESKVPIRQKLISQSILDDHVKISRLDVLDTLLMARLNGAEHNYQILDAKSLQPIGDLAKIGGGPNEFSDFLRYSHFEYEGNELFVYVNDVNKYRFCRINVTKSLEEKTTIIDRYVQLNPDINFSFAFEVDTSYLVGTVTNQTAEMVSLQGFDVNSGKIKALTPLMPEVPHNDQSIEFLMYKYNYLFVSSISMKPDKTRFALLGGNFDRLDLIEVSGQVIKSVQSEVYDAGVLDSYLKEPDSEKEDQYPIKNYYMDSFASDKYIYGLYYGQLASEHGDKTDVGTEIHVFDWDGTLLHVWELPDYLVNFSLSESLGVLFGVDHYNERIVSYQIEDLF